MEPLLFLAHRIPYPPNKGDKIRSYHLLRHLAQRYAVHLGTFIDDPADRAHLPALETLCESVCAVEIAPAFAKVRSLTGLLSGEALTVPYYRAPALRRWVDATIRAHRVDRCLVFCSAMAQFVDDQPGLRAVVDFCDVDSAKWQQYSASRPWPSSAIYRREAKRLLDFERAVARRSAASVFATAAEAGMFIGLAPESASTVHVVASGVDSAYFSPDAVRPTPYGPNELPIVFTGAMNYWPNVDAVCWFATEVLPRLVAREPSVRFYVVGMNPARTVEQLTRNPRIVVTGRVPDVRPYVQHARLVVVPLRLARGMQSKVLEAMAMARPLLMSAASAEGVSGRAGEDFEIAAGADEYVHKALAMLTDRRFEAMGRRARERVVAAHDWSRNLAEFERLLAPSRVEVQRALRNVDARAAHAR